jgi:hypothetical protein
MTGRLALTRKAGMIGLSRLRISPSLSSRGVAFLCRFLAGPRSQANDDVDDHFLSCSKVIGLMSELRTMMTANGRDAKWCVRGWKRFFGICSNTSVKFPK